ncbi:MAG: hypothetical protein KDJ75_06950 [Alphaproteobacteria bacterium]|nr:hypothetical protein [Alphaproteobacteria bacterium]
MTLTMQSTNRLLMVEPASFYANPQTMATNVYQAPDAEPHEATFHRALEEFRVFRDKLVENGVIVTTIKGDAACPDAVFPNGFSTHADGRLFIYPMLNENRQKERIPALLDALARAYPHVKDWTGYEAEGLSLESTASICMDRANKIGYAGLSSRTDRALVKKWCAEMDYEPVIFETQSHKGPPVYHTDCLMYIGTSMAALCTPCIAPEDRERVFSKLSATHEVLELTMEQLAAFSGNALEVQGRDGKKMLAISDGAFKALFSAQSAMIGKHFDGVVSAPLTTLEKYGGGSARCMLAELF